MVLRMGPGNEATSYRDVNTDKELAKDKLQNKQQSHISNTYNF